jgi:sugar phosphate permease
MFVHHVTFYTFKIFVIEWNNVYTLKLTEISLDILRCLVFVFGATALSGSGSLHSRDFLDRTKRRPTVGRTPLEE